jgi:hypothetical protein
MYTSERVDELIFRRVEPVKDTADFRVSKSNLWRRSEGLLWSASTLRFACVVPESVSDEVDGAICKLLPNRCSLEVGLRVILLTNGELSFQPRQEEFNNCWAFEQAKEPGCMCVLLYIYTLYISRLLLPPPNQPKADVRSSYHRIYTILLPSLFAPCDDPREDVSPFSLS